MAYSSSMGDRYAYVLSSSVAARAGSAWFSTTNGTDLHKSKSAPTIGFHGFFTLIHEPGHALALNHMGDCNAGNGRIPTPSSY